MLPDETGRRAGLSYERHGALAAGAEPLVLLTGLLGDSRRLRRLVRDLRARCARPILLVDPIGGGNSDAPADPAAYSWDRQVARLLELLDDLCPGPIDVLGLSLGGMWAQQLHLVAPARLRHVILAGSCVAASPRLRALVASLSAQLLSDLSPLDLGRCLMLLLFSPSFLDRPGAVPLLSGMLTEAPPPRAGLLGQLQSIVAHDASGRLSALKAQLIAGDLDWVTPPCDQARLRSELQRAALTMLPDGGHCLWIEQPQAFAEAVHRALGDA